MAKQAHGGLNQTDIGKIVTFSTDTGLAGEVLRGRLVGIAHQAGSASNERTHTVVTVQALNVTFERRLRPDEMIDIEP